MPFLHPVDIANRALQHCGSPRIEDFEEDSKGASEVSFIYDTTRRAELRRNVWRFAIRRVALRPIDVDTRFIKPVLWDSSMSYPPGAIVSTADNLLWISKIPDNLNTGPGLAAAWEAYFGPLTASQFDPTTAYFSGELVYKSDGSGRFALYSSLMNANDVDPSVPSEWSATATYSKDSIVQFPLNWLIGTTYAAGAAVSYNGSVYISLAAANLGAQPDISPSAWVLQPTAGASNWSTTATYAIGQFVLYLGQIYVSIVNSNLNNLPTNAAFWAAQAAPVMYRSLMGLNLNNEPDLAPLPWTASTTYVIANTVVGSDGFIYSSVVNANLGKDPVLDNGVNWTNTGFLGAWVAYNGPAVSSQWVKVTAALDDVDFTYPIGSGPVIQSATRNVYRFPSGFLLKAPTDPKAGSQSFLGAPSGLQYDDWLLEGNYIVTRESTPIILRFVADITDVRTMDDMFCEGLGARIGLEVCETLTQSGSKLKDIAAAYRGFMGEARDVNGIETGSIEPPEDDYITCRA